MNKKFALCINFATKFQKNILIYKTRGWGLNETIFSQKILSIINTKSQDSSWKPNQLPVHKYINLIIKFSKSKLYIFLGYYQRLVFNSKHCNISARRVWNCVHCQEESPIKRFEKAAISLHIQIFFLFIAEIKEKNESFGTSLLLANIGPNSPNTPKIVDGSFAGI